MLYVALLASADNAAHLQGEDDTAGSEPDPVAQVVNHDVPANKKRKKSRVRGTDTNGDALPFRQPVLRGNFAGSVSKQSSGLT